MKVGDLIEVYDVRNGWSPAVIVEINTSTHRADSIKVLRDGVVKTTTSLWCRDPVTQKRYRYGTET
jgi:hypothetical protein